MNKVRHHESISQSLLSKYFSANYLSEGVYWCLKTELYIKTDLDDNIIPIQLYFFLYESVYA